MDYLSKWDWIFWALIRCQENKWGGRGGGRVGSSQGGPRGVGGVGLG